MQRSLSKLSYWGILVMGTGIFCVALHQTPVYLMALLIYLGLFGLAGLWRSSDRSMLGPIALLAPLAIGILQHIDPQLAQKQLLWLGVGCGVYVVVRTPVIARSILRYSAPLFYATLVALVVTIVAGTDVGGARSWLRIGEFSVQPIEMVKLSLVLFWASMAHYNAGRYPQHVVRDEMAKRIIWTMVVGFLLVLQRDLGPIVILFITGALWYRAGRPSLKHALGVAFGLVGAASVAWLSFTHVRVRFMGWLHPWSDPFGAGYQTLRARFAMSRGGFFGQGWFTASTDVPAVATDLPLVGVIERLGFFGGLFVLIVLTVFLRNIFLMKRDCTDPYARGVVHGIGLLITVQTAIVVGGTLGLSPMIGLTMPIFSYGGSALVTFFTQLGLIGYIHGRETERGSREEGKRLVSVPIVSRTLAIMTLMLLFPLLYRTVIDFPRLAAHPIVQAQSRGEAGNAREGIVGRNGEKFSSTVATGYRHLEPDSLVHVIGYVDPVYGMAGLEATFDEQLTGGAVFRSGGRLIPHESVRWAVHTTLDRRLQDVVDKAFGDNNGAVVVLDPWSGDILAATSSPRFVPSDLEAAMRASEKEAPLLNRAFQGLYPPGSAFKVVTMAAAIEAGVADRSTTWFDAGTVLVDGYRISNPGGNAYGMLTPEAALARSSNVVFARLAAAVGAQGLRMQAHAFGIGQPQNIQVPYRSGHIGSLDGPVELAVAGLGQGSLLVTPLEMALVAASVANGGYKVRPRLVSHLTTEKLVDPIFQEEPSRVMSRTTVHMLADGMREAVSIGTAANIGDPALWAGKTGTAENPHGAPHAWFIGFAPAYHPVVAMAVLVENGGSGARVAAPIAYEIARAIADKSFAP